MSQGTHGGSDYKCNGRLIPAAGGGSIGRMRLFADAGVPAELAVLAGSACVAGLAAAAGLVFFGLWLVRRNRTPGPPA